MTKVKTLKIQPGALEVLRRSTFNGDRLDLPEQLTPSQYQAVKKAIVTAGGKWVKKMNTHVFPGSARLAFGDALETGKMVDEKATFQAFFTPPAVAGQASELLLAAMGRPECPAILEPSAGEGALALAVLARCPGALVDCIEIQPKLAAALKCRNDFFQVVEMDFLKDTPERTGLYDGVIMNPPFTGDQDAAHVLHAFNYVKPGGVLVAIVSPRYCYATTGKCNALRDLLASRGIAAGELEAGSFSESGTEVRTMLLGFRK